MGARASCSNSEFLNVEQEQHRQSEHPVQSQTREEISEYQLEMIRQEAHEIWLIRRGNHQPGSEASDWEEAERHYFSNN